MTETLIRERVPSDAVEPSVIEAAGLAELEDERLADDDLDDLDDELGHEEFDGDFDDELEEPGLVLGRPLEDRSFEAVEASVGLLAGVAVGATLGGPVGGVVGGIVGLAGGLATGEAVERAVGRAATTTDATRPARGHVERPDQG